MYAPAAARVGRRDRPAPPRILCQRHANASATRLPPPLHCHRHFFTATATPPAEAMSLTNSCVERVGVQLFRATRAGRYADFMERLQLNGVMGTQRGSRPGQSVHHRPSAPFSCLLVFQPHASEGQRLRPSGASKKRLLAPLRRPAPSPSYVTTILL